MKFQEVFQKLKQKFKDTIPDWFFAVLQMFYWALNPKYPFIKIFPAKGYWIAQYKGKRLCVPSPRTAILGHFIRSYELVYERYFSVEKDEIVLDVGAYVGSFTIEVARRAKKVLAIEPDPKNYKCLKINILKFPNVRTVNKGVWNSKSKLKLYVDPHYPLANSIVIPPTGNNFIEIEVDTLDKIASELGFGVVDFVKINVEGAELEALQGMENILKSVKKLVMDAHHIRNGAPTWPLVCKFLEDRGFETRVDKEIETVYAWKK